MLDWFIHELVWQSPLFDRIIELLLEMYEYTTSLKDRLEVVVLVSSRVEAGLTSQLSSIIILVTITIYYIAVIVIGIFIVIFINEYNINFFSPD